MTFPRQRFILSAEILLASSFAEVHATFDQMIDCGICKPPYPLFDIEVPQWIALGFESPAAFSAHFADIAKVFTEGLGRDLGCDAISAGNPLAGSTYRFRKAEKIGLYWPGNHNESSEIILDDILATPLDRDFGQSCDPISIFNPGELPEAAKNSVVGLTDYLFRLKLQRRAACIYLYECLIVFLASKCASKTLTTDKLAKLGIGSKSAKRRYHYTTHIGVNYETVPLGTGTHPAPKMHLRRGHPRLQAYGPGLGLRRKIFVEPTWVNRDETISIDDLPVRDHYNVNRHLQAPGSLRG